MKGCISGASRKFDDENENEDAAESRVSSTLCVVLGKTLCQ